MPVTNIVPEFPWNTDGGIVPVWMDGSIPITVTVDDGVENYDYINLDLEDVFEGVTLPTFRCFRESITSFNVGVFRFRLGQILPSFWGSRFPLPESISGSDYKSTNWVKKITFTFSLGGYTRPLNEFNEFYFGAAQYYGHQRYEIGNNVNDNLKIVSEDNNTFWFPKNTSLSFQQNMLIPFQVVGNQNNGIVNATGDGIGVSVPLDDNRQLYYINVFEAEYSSSDYELGNNVLEARFGASLENLFYSINMRLYESCDDDLLVRYIDRNGMLRFTSFNFKYAANEDPEEIGRYENINIGSPAMADSDQYSIGFDTIRTLTCTRDNVEEAELKYLSDMKSSRFVQYYDVLKGDWVRLSPQPSSFRERGGTGEYNTITISFDLPTVKNLNLL